MMAAPRRVARSRMPSPTRMAPILAAIRPILAETHDWDTYNSAVTKLSKLLSEQWGFNNHPCCGLYKMCFIHPDGFVLKLPKFTSNWNRVEEEAQAMVTLNRQCPRRFPITQSYGDGVHVQEALPLDVTKHTEKSRYIYRTAARFGVTDVHHQNVGWRGNDYVFIDHSFVVPRGS